MDPFLLMVMVIVVAVVFEYINGFHDAANAIATVVSTRVLTPRQAIMLAAVTNLFGAFWGTAVAKTIYSGYIDMAGGHIAIEGMQLAIACGLMGGIVWNLITWWFGIPSSSSHALIGGLCGGVLGLTHLNWNSLIWSATDSAGKTVGLWPKLIKPMVISPFVGFTLGVIFMMLLTMLIVRLSVRPSIVSKVFGKLQLVSAGLMGFSHGSNDSQKTVGIITFALIVGVGAGAFDPAHAPSWAQWFKPTLNAKNGVDQVPLWIIALCAVTMAAGTAAGGWRIIRTMGHKMVKLQPVHGFAAETAAAITITGASELGIPLSTTHVISTSILGVGASKRFDAVRWGLVGRIVWAWVLTIPITLTLGYLFFRGCVLVGWAK
ncbi:MAG: inorganic phosphate transporter [Opitutales bacterium]|jgi:inorganic phosphate transporter, PiT family|nr:inorganic phosphate transporter [Opitutales bacterium]MDP4659844.1 inorganic phosphate transporter [Opitutales bacterium]MDP4776117.1 inorganic phosphate transporter [Opitutales bacterium]MDP4786505.1 inorganic phosphate transporter [Opitutales bacterium]MDP4861652.1 inorganic phosphate transporter [Opitutales bacterium]